MFNQIKNRISLIQPHIKVDVTDHLSHLKDENSFQLYSDKIGQLSSTHFRFVAWVYFYWYTNVSPTDLSKYVDHTILKAVATHKDVEQLCKEAIQHKFAAVCVNGCRVQLAIDTLRSLSPGTTNLLDDYN